MTSGYAAIVLYDFTGEVPGDLTVTAGEEVTILPHLGADEGWVQATLGVDAAGLGMSIDASVSAACRAEASAPTWVAANNSTSQSASSEVPTLW